MTENTPQLTQEHRTYRASLLLKLLGYTESFSVIPVKGTYKKGKKAGRDYLQVRVLAYSPSTGEEFEYTAWHRHFPTPADLEGLKGKKVVDATLRFGSFEGEESEKPKWRELIFEDGSRLSCSGDEVPFEEQQ